MKHPFETLQPEYDALLAQMVVTKVDEVNSVAQKLRSNYQAGRYSDVSKATGIPIIFIAPSFEREASSNFRLSPAQGDPWNEPSVHVPAHRGPFPDWKSAALDAYHLNGLDAVKTWKWSTLCFYGELFNGMGYRDAHRIHSPYLWGGTNIQQRGKYVRDGVWDGTIMDSQLGIIPMAKRLSEICPELVLSNNPFIATSASDAVVPSEPMRAPVGVGGGRAHDTMWIQMSLNKLGQLPPIDEDGSYGRQTMMAVRAFQEAHHLHVDGLAGTEETIPAIATELKARSLS